MDIAGRRQAALNLMEREGVDVMLVAPNELNRIEMSYSINPSSSSRPLL